MNETSFRGVLIKTIAIIGFFATIILFAWLVAEGIKRAPAAFSSLASIAGSISDYREVNELSLATEKSVVNSNESFQISWTDVKQKGEYHFSYTCTRGVDLLVRGGDGALVPVSCTDTLSLPATVHGLFLSVTSEEMRFTDIPLKVTFTNDAKDKTLESETKITVVNATIPTTDEPEVVKEEVPVTPVPKPETTPSTPTPTPTVTKPVVLKPVPTAVYPQSNPNGFIDLTVTTLGSGVLKNGVFVYTAKYDTDLQNSIRFDIRNIGTKTSGDWTFTTILPDGTIYTSPTQIGLKPHEHVVFTLGFSLDDSMKNDFVEIKNTVYTYGESNTKNNTSVWSVAVSR